METSATNGPSCAFCNSKRMRLVVDFGEMALAGAFVKPEEFSSEQTFPLHLHFCEDCFAVQVTDKVPADIMFKKYFYFSSSIGTLRAHFQQYAADVTRRFLTPAKASVLEFGCNDGVLLRPLADQGIRTVIGVDPASNVVSAIDDARVIVINDYFSEQSFGPLRHDGVRHQANSNSCRLDSILRLQERRQIQRVSFTGDPGA